MPAAVMARRAQRANDEDARLRFEQRRKMASASAEALRSMLLERD